MFVMLVAIAFLDGWVMGQRRHRLDVPLGVRHLTPSPHSHH